MCAIIEVLPAVFDVFGVILHSWSKADVLTADSVARVASTCAAEDVVLRGHQHQHTGLTNMDLKNMIASDKSPGMHHSDEHVSSSTPLRGPVAEPGTQGEDSSNETGSASRQCHVNGGASTKRRPSDRVHANGVAGGSRKAGRDALVSYTARAAAQQSRTGKATQAFKHRQRPKLPKCRFCLGTFISERALMTHLARNPACKHQDRSHRSQRSGAQGPTCQFCLRAFISQHALTVHLRLNLACKQHQEAYSKRKDESDGCRTGAKKRFYSAEQTVLLNKYFLQHSTRSDAEYDHIAKHVSMLAGGKVVSPPTARRSLLARTCPLTPSSAGASFARMEA